MGIKCCRYCVPPERTPTCHSTCEKYLKEKEEIEKENKIARNNKRYIPSPYEYDKIAYYSGKNIKKSREEKRRSNK